jgi:hypothetical protein
MITLDDFLADPVSSVQHCLTTGAPLTIVQGSLLSPDETLLILAPARLAHAQQAAQGVPPCQGTGTCLLLGCPRKAPHGGSPAPGT